jgi:hypothetical protein
MKTEIYIAFSMSALCSVVMGLTNGQIEAQNVEHAQIEELPLDAPIYGTNSSRAFLVSFDFPETFIDENNMIVEGILDLDIEPVDYGGTIAAVSMPFSKKNGDDEIATIHRDLAVFGTLDNDRESMLFEIGRVIYAIIDGELDFDGFVVVPIDGSNRFDVSENNKAKINISYYRCGQYVKE